MQSRAWVLCGVLIGLVAAESGVAAADGETWQAGVARVKITPREKLLLAGYTHRPPAADGTSQELFAKALALRGTDGTRLVLVTCDLGSMDPAITAHVASAAQAAHGLPRSAVVLNVSHTHCAPEICEERRVFHDLAPEVDAKITAYIEHELQPRLIEVIGAALKDLAPAKLLFSQSAAEFGRNRRFPTPDGFVNQRNDDGVTDHDVPVLRIVAPDGALRGVWFGYACHNTTLMFNQYSGDYAGYAQEFVERAHPGVIAGFVMGCGGDQNPYPRHGEMQLEHARSHGRALADAVESALDDPRPVAIAPTLKVASTDVELDLEPLPPLDDLKTQAAMGKSLAARKARYLLSLLERDGKIELKEHCPLHAAQLGDELLWIFVSGETTVDYSRKPKAEFQGSSVWVAGYCDDVFAYLPSLRVLQEGGYEGRTGILHQLTPTPFATSVEEKVMGGIRAVVGEVRPKKK